jgi:ketosteroid isomerase-like protein
MKIISSSAILALGVATAFLALSVPMQADEKEKQDQDKAQIEMLEKRYNQAFNSKDVDGIMACYAPGTSLFVFDAIPPREYPSWEAYKKHWEGLFACYPCPLSNTISEQSITVVGSVAYGHSIQSGFFTRKDGSKVNSAVRVTDVYRKINGKWLIVHEHVSFPVDIDTGKADLLSKP